MQYNATQCLRLVTNVLNQYIGFYLRPQRHCEFMIWLTDCPPLRLSCVGSNPGISGNKYDDIVVYTRPYSRDRTTELVINLILQAHPVFSMAL